MSFPATSRCQTPMGGSEERLNSQELSALTGLLYRAVAHGQVQQVLDNYRASRAPGSTLVPCAAFISEFQCVAMDAQERRLEADASEHQSSVDEESDCDRSSSVSHNFVPKYDDSMENLLLWVALSPKQMEELDLKGKVVPDGYANRLGLRVAGMGAVDQAQYFMDWQKDYKVLQVEFTALGCQRYMGAGILEKTGPDEYHWCEYHWIGCLKQEDRDEQGRVLYRISDTVMQTS